MDEVHARARLQAAIDFMVSYGFAILVIAIAVYVVLQLGVYQPGLTPQSCTAEPGFACVSYALFRNGTLDVELAQAQGGTINITGAACASSPNVAGDGPAFGNVNVFRYNSITQQYYPDASMANGIIAYSDTRFTVKTYCYGSGGVAGPSYGSMFNGYLWLNYTNAALPSGMHSTVMVAQLTAKYT